MQPVQLLFVIFLQHLQQVSFPVLCHDVQFSIGADTQVLQQPVRCRIAVETASKISACALEAASTGRPRAPAQRACTNMNEHLYGL